MRDFIHVRNVGELAPISGCFNAGSGKGDKVNQIVRLTAKLTDRDLQVGYKPGRGFGFLRIVLDIGRIRQAAGWVPSVPLEEGVRENWAWIRNQKLAFAAT